MNQEYEQHGRTRKPLVQLCRIFSQKCKNDVKNLLISSYGLFMPTSIVLIFFFLTGSVFLETELNGLNLDCI
jgi:hypothetical protein